MKVSAAITLLIGLGGLAGAQDVPDCVNTPLPTPLGFRCVERHPIRAQNGTDSYTSTSSPEWVTLTTRWLEESRYGDADGPHIQDFASTTVANVKNSWSAFSARLSEYDGRAKLTDPDTGQPVEYSLYQKDRDEYSRKYDTLTQVSTNVAYVSASASAQRRCKTRVLGTCVDWQGGSLTGVLEIYRMYIGSAATAQAEFDKLARQGDALPRQLTLTNTCAEDITVALGRSGSEASGWWTIPAGASIRPSVQGTPYTVNDRSSLYFYAKSKSWEWRGETTKTLDGRALGMRAVQYKNDGAQATVTLTCGDG